MIGCEETGSDVPRKGKTSKKRMKARATPKLPQVNNITSDSFGTSTNYIRNNSSVIGFHSDVPRTKKTYERKKAGATRELPQVNMIDGLLGLNGNNPSFSVEKMPFSRTSTSKVNLYQRGIRRD
ncbi:uncharacterized protein Fot_34202 [Forsythia ovata]|uniref:Uncharacterized protein n=1 Tax=Forsythia ovata TaxID=205694 RepID=A0ABD1SJF7_9LAMI